MNIIEYVLARKGMNELEEYLKNLVFHKQKIR